MFQLLSDTQKGILYIAGGTILFLHTLGIIEKGLNTIIIIGSLIMIAYGFFKAGGHKKLPQLLGKKSPPPPNDEGNF